MHFIGLTSIHAQLVILPKFYKTIQWHYLTTVQCRWVELNVLIKSLPISNNTIIKKVTVQVRSNNLLASVALIAKAGSRRNGGKSWRISDNETAQQAP